MELTPLIDGLDFGEGPRWHDNQLWYSDFYQHSVYSVTSEGDRNAVVTIEDQPSGLGWLPDGDLLIVPEKGTLTLQTELGVLVVPPKEIAVVPRGVKFAVAVDTPARG